MATQIVSPRHRSDLRARRWAREVWSQAPGWVWRLRNLTERDPFAVQRPDGLRRLAVCADDGGGLDVFAMPTRANAAGEPVAVLATLGLHPTALLAGTGARWLDRLVDEGFAPYLIAHRACRRPEDPGGPGAVDFDAVVDHDLPAALDQIARDSGYPRAHLVGHGLGGQLWLAYAAVHGAERIASVVAIAAPVRFPVGKSPGWWARAAHALPTAVTLPTRALGRWSAGLGAADGGGRGVARRAALAHGSVDVSGALVAQLVAWLGAGSLVDRAGGRDYVAGLAGVGEPLLVVAGEGDALCPRAAALAVREAWRAGAVTVAELPPTWDHLDAVLHPEAGRVLGDALIPWLRGHRLRAWRGREVVDLGRGLVRPKP